MLERITARERLDREAASAERFAWGMAIGPIAAWIGWTFFVVIWIAIIVGKGEWAARTFIPIEGFLVSAGWLIASLGLVFSFIPRVRMISSSAFMLLFHCGGFLGACASAFIVYLHWGRWALVISALFIGHGVTVAAMLSSALMRDWSAFWTPLQWITVTWGSMIISALVTNLEGRRLAKLEALADAEDALKTNEPVNT